MVFFPIAVLNVLGGFLFEPNHALIINSIGVLVELTIPYWIGRTSGTNFVDKLCQKHSKLAEIIGESSDNNFFMSFFLRVISCLPGDVVGMYFGASKVAFWTYLLGSFLGTLPGTIAKTLIGMSITDPTSPMFWVSIGLTVSISMISFLIYFIWRKTKKKKTLECKEDIYGLKMAEKTIAETLLHHFVTGDTTGYNDLYISEFQSCFSYDQPHTDIVQHTRLHIHSV